jgi:hypothetical protein
MQIEFSDELLALNPMAPPEESDPDIFAGLRDLLKPKEETPAESIEASDVMTIEQRLKLAFSQGVPRDVISFFRWDFLTADTRPGIIANNIQRASESAAGGIQAAKDRLVKSEERLIGLKRQAQEAKDGIENPSLDLSPVEVGRNALVQLGCSKLIPLAEQEITHARVELARAERHADNWDALARYSDVIIHVKQPDDRLAQRFGFTHAWELAPAHVREAERTAREKAAAEAKVKYAKFAKEQDVLQAKVTEQQQNAAAEIAVVGAMSFSDLVHYLGAYGNAMKALTTDPRNSHLIALVRADFERPYGNSAQELARQRLLGFVSDGLATAVEGWNDGNEKSK